jgi:arabinogalactan endo-1,4-beta-galactosidase
MTENERQEHDALSAIGWELFDRRQAGLLDFDAFKSLLRRAIDAVGADNPDLEMFCHYARGEGWFDWMTKEIQQASSRHVA